MKITFSCKLITFILTIVTLLTALPLTAFAQEGESVENDELYLKSVKLAQGKKEEARAALLADGYIFLDQNLNEGTGQDGVWMGYQTTTDPSQAIYDMKLMNMKGGFTLTSMKEALATQESAFAEMTADLNYLVEEFVEAYNEGSVPAQKAYKALNFFRVVNGETELAEENGLGYQIVNGGVTQSMLTEIIMFCNPDLVDSIETGICQQQCVRVGKADILRGENHKSAGDKSRFLATRQHSCQVVDSCIGITAADTLDKCRDYVVVLLAILVVEGDVLLQTLGDVAVVDCDFAIGRTNQDVEDVEQLAGITARKLKEGCRLAHLDFALLQLGIGRQRAIEQALQILVAHRGQRIDLAAAQQRRYDLE